MKNCENCYNPDDCLLRFTEEINHDGCPFWLSEEDYRDEILLGYLENQSPE